MGSIANPLLTSMLPPTNVTGSNIAVPGSAPSSSGQNPLLPSPGTSTSAPTSSNPIAAGFPANGPGATSLTGPPNLPATNAGQAAGSPIGGISTMSPTDISRLFDSLKKTYGDGPAHALLDFLTSGAGFNQSAINNLFAAMQPQIERGTESLMTQFSASGNRFGSGAQIGLGDFLSQVNLNEGQLETQMYESAINNYLQVLMGTSGAAAQTKANSPSTMDSILSGLQLGGAGAQGLLSAGVGGGSGTLSSILSGIAGVAL